MDINALIGGVALAVALLGLMLFLRERALRQTHEVPQGLQVEITVGKVLQHEAIWVFPIVKSLAAQNMLADPK